MPDPMNLMEASPVVGYAASDWVYVVRGGTTDGRMQLSTMEAAVLVQAQPLNATLTTIAGLSTTAFGRGFLVLANAGAAITYLGLSGLMAAQTPDDVEITGGVISGTTVNDIVPGDFVTLAALAALATQTYGLNFLTLADAAAARTYIGLTLSDLAQRTADNTFTQLNTFSKASTGADENIPLLISPTWDTSGNPAALRINVTNTASGATSYLLDVKSGGVPRFQVLPDGRIQCGGPVRVSGYLVSALPVLTGSGWHSYVSDALAPAWGSPVVGGGAETVPVFYNGSAWIVG